MSDSKFLAQLLDAPRRFSVVDDNHWLGRPSVAYGAVRRLAFEERAKAATPLLRVHLGQGGRRGDPWGALSLEVNGSVYSFNAGLTSRPELHDGKGGLVTEGNELLASGLPGNLVRGCDWRWVQDEVDLTSLFSPQAIRQVAKQYNLWYDGHSPLPLFQSRIWAQRLDRPIVGHNCTSSIVAALRRAGLNSVSGWFPLSVFDALKSRATGRNKLDDKLNFLLWQKESALLKALEMLSPGIDWNAFAKGTLKKEEAPWTCDALASCLEWLTDYSHFDPP